MKILERPNGSRYWCASLANFGYPTLEVSLDGEVYKYGIPSTTECCEAERVGNKWKIHKYDVSGNLIEQVIQRDVLVGCAWYNVDESLWENSIYADTISRCKEFFSIPNGDKAKTDYQTKNGFSYYVTRYGEIWNTETMTKVKGSVNSSTGYRHIILRSVPTVKFHRLVAYHFVRIPKDLLDQGLTKETLVVSHLDGDKLNNRWDNLEWTTKGNRAHASATGLLHTTIDDHLLEHVFKRLQEGYSDANISKETGISRPTVSQIRRGKSRRYRTDKYTWPKSSVDARMKESRELAMKCVKMFNQGMSYKTIADKLGFNSTRPVRTLIDKCKDLITRKPHKLDKDTIFNIYDEFTYTDKNNCEIGRQYNVSNQFISDLRRGRYCSNLAREYVTSKGLDGYWQGYRHPK